jgi:hypothetical protein
MQKVYVLQHENMNVQWISTCLKICMIQLLYDGSDGDMVIMMMMVVVVVVVEKW